MKKSITGLNQTTSLNLTAAQNILRGEKVTVEEILALVKKLKAEKDFTFSRRLLERARGYAEAKQSADLKLKVHQQWVLCTYKDTDLPADKRLDDALKILNEADNLDRTKDQETLGLAGAIYKRKWEIDNQKLQLERSFLYYERGYAEGAENDFGYTGINAAFVLDLLACQEETAAKETNSVSETAPKRRAKAGRIRQDILEKILTLEKSDSGWWFYATVAEAFFGIKKYDEAVAWLERGKEKIGTVPEWEMESTILQLARLAILQYDSELAGVEFSRTAAWRALEKFYGKNSAAVLSAFTGKIGLALSGGGFRASLFHIGMLARLAELDVLRRVEVISCVSGGSIIGAHYYLEVRKLLQSKTDEEIAKQDYIEIVRRIERDFLAGVQRNVRVRIAAEFLTNLKMMFSSKYSRTLRAGELYEEEIFSKVSDGEENSPRYLNRLNIYPMGEARDFAPKLHNWRRAAKAPILMLNATTLNTGHNWQFTTTWMGEPPSSIDTEVDTNDQLRRMYYPEAPAEHQSVRLGHAVAASAGVPGIFDPLSLENLYPNRIVRLVDGGVCDNQGVNSLLEQDCAVILTSDGSGQMESLDVPSGGLLGVPLRANSILQARIRDAQYHDLERRRRSSLLRGLMFIHLKEDLTPQPIDWIGCLDPIDGASKQILTRYGIAKDIQRQLAAIRTDLDSFSDVEAYALMTSAYRMTENAFKNGKCVDGFDDGGETVDWNFLKIEVAMKGQGEKYNYVKKLLGASDLPAFKIWKQSSVLKTSALLAGLVFIALTVYSFFIFSQTVLLDAITVGGVGKWLAGIILITIATYVFGTIVKVVRWRETLTRIAIGIAMCLFGWIFARIHLHLFDKMFLKRGSLTSFFGLNNK